MQGTVSPDALTTLQTTHPPTRVPHPPWCYHRVQVYKSLILQYTRLEHYWSTNQKWRGLHTHTYVGDATWHTGIAVFHSYHASTGTHFTDNIYLSQDTCIPHESDILCQKSLSDVGARGNNRCHAAAGGHCKGAAEGIVQRQSFPQSTEHVLITFMMIGSQCSCYSRNDGDSNSMVTVRCSHFVFCTVNITRVCRAVTQDC